MNLSKGKLKSIFSEENLKLSSGALLIALVIAAAHWEKKKSLNPHYDHVATVVKGDTTDLGFFQNASEHNGVEGYGTYLKTIDGEEKLIPVEDYDEVLITKDSIAKKEFELL